MTVVVDDCVMGATRGILAELEFWSFGSTTWQGTAGLWQTILTGHPDLLLGSQPATWFGAYDNSNLGSLGIIHAELNLTQFTPSYPVKMKNSSFKLLHDC